MVLLLIGVIVGVLLVLILVTKVIKTSSKEVLGMKVFCQKCGHLTNGVNCPKCDKRPQFGV